MLFTKITTVLVAAFAAQSWAATFSSATDAIGTLEPINNSIEKIVGEIKKSPGGMTELLTIAGSIYSVCDQAQAGLNKLEGMGHFTPEDEKKGNPHMQKLTTGLTDAVDATAGKVDMIKAVPGGPFIAQRVAECVRKAKTRLVFILQSKSSAQSYQKHMPAIKNFDKKYDAVIKDMMS
ncbi:hypothetical protein FQN49_000746 [Arthroderma sp. PD_2]|nr:hypothetical protein FQN49_000746 [Arthroderma sp. PD_2]